MTLRTRLWLFGAGVPSLGALALVAAAGLLLRYRLGAALDQALLTQAAVESVSLFDAPGGKIHLHLERSPLLEAVQPFAPAAEVFDERGELELAYPPGEPRLALNAAALLGRARPVLQDVRTVHGEVRRGLSVAVHDGQGHSHLLLLHASTGQIAAATGTFFRIGLLGVSLLAGLLFAVQLAQGRTLARRIARLREHLREVERGELEEAPEDPRSDEVGALAGVLAAATRALRAAREAEERLAAEAAHELRTPLTLMRTEIELALRRPRSNEELSGALRGVKAEVIRLEELTERLLDLSRLGREPRRVACDLRALLVRAAGPLRPVAAARGVSLVLDTGGPAPLTADPVAVRQLLGNLLDNAVKFSPPQGTVTARVIREGARWRLEVHDDGPGVPEAERERVFHPFHRLDPEVPGTGLGLAIVREVAERHGGRAGFGDPPRGATAFVELPAA